MLRLGARMNYLDQWTFFPELPSQVKEENKIQLYRYVPTNQVMTGGNVGAILSHLHSVYYSKEALDSLKDSLLFATATSQVGYSYKYSFQNNLPKPSLPYYPLTV
jgi:hypothetical protein